MPLRLMGNGIFLFVCFKIGTYLQKLLATSQKPPLPDLFQNLLEHGPITYRYLEPFEG